MDALKKTIHFIKKYFLILIKKHHFVFLLILFALFISWTGWIFWKEVYFAINSPATNSAVLVKINKPNAEQLEALFSSRGMFSASTSIRQFPNLFR